MNYARPRAVAFVPTERRQANIQNDPNADSKADLVELWPIDPLPSSLWILITTFLDRSVSPCSLRLRRRGNLANFVIDALKRRAPSWQIIPIHCRALDSSDRVPSIQACLEFPRSSGSDVLCDDARSLLLCRRIPFLEAGWGRLKGEDRVNF